MLEIVQDKGNVDQAILELQKRLLLCLEGVPDLPVAPQDEAGLTTTFQTWPRGWFHIPKDPDFPVPS